MSGRTLRAVVSAIRHTPARRVVSRVLRGQLGIEAVRRLGAEARGDLPVSVLPTRARSDHARSSAELGVPGRGDWPRTSATYAAALREGLVDPEQLVDRALSGAERLAARSPGGSVLLHADGQRARDAARDAAARLKEGSPLGPLDGVPVAIKEEMDVEGLPNRVGTSWMTPVPAASDCTVAARLRRAGAIIIGTTPMTEYGLSPLGVNPNRDMPRNAHAPDRLPGGSSSGSGVAVAAGVVPMALGIDGGGSVRIPACLNGVFGLKPTYGRIPLTGEGLKGGSSVAHPGPLGASTYDLAVFTEITAGPDGQDAAAESAPRLEKDELVRALGRGVRGLRIGVDEDEWNAASSDAALPAREALDALEREGATLVRVRMKWARHAPAIGYLTIGLEAFSAMVDVRQEHMDELGLDMQLLLAAMETFRADDYLDAQRLRAELRREVAAVLADVDVLALPTTARGAPAVSDQEAREGFVDPPALDAMCRFAFLGNLTGLPAGTAPVGFDGEHMPVGLQIVGDAWDEATVLSVLAHLERIGQACVVKPASFVDLLAD